MKIENFILPLIDQANQRGHYSKASAYLSTLHCYQRYIQNPSSDFEEFTPQRMKEFEDHMHRIGLKKNTISLYFRMLRSICNQAVKQGVVHLNTPDLFSDVFTGNQETAKRAVHPEVIRRIKNADLSNCPQLSISRDYFLLSFYLQGISFVDLAYLKKLDLTGAFLAYSRKKTNKKLYIMIEDCAAKIINKMAKKCKDSIFLLPIITEMGERGYVQYRSALRLYNNHLEQLSERLHLDVKLTSYVSRHTWATTAKNTHIPVSVISTSMGHSSEKVTYTYLKSFDEKKLSDANKKVIAAINEPNKKRKEGKKNSHT